MTPAVLDVAQGFAWVALALAIIVPWFVGLVQIINVLERGMKGSPRG